MEASANGGPFTLCHWCLTGLRMPDIASGMSQCARRGHRNDRQIIGLGLGLSSLPHCRLLGAGARQSSCVSDFLLASGGPAGGPGWWMRRHGAVRGQPSSIESLMKNDGEGGRTPTRCLRDRPQLPPIASTPLTCWPPGGLTVLPGGRWPAHQRPRRATRARFCWLAGPGGELPSQRWQPRPASLGIEPFRGPVRRARCSVRQPRAGPRRRR